MDPQPCRLRMTIKRVCLKKEKDIKMTRFKGMMKQKLAGFIPGAFNRALCSYRSFSARNIDMDETKEFSAYHSACKNALSHIDNLIKLSAVSEVEEDTKKAEEDSLQNILEEAQTELKKINNDL